MRPDSLAHDQNAFLPEGQDAMALHLHPKNRRYKNARAHSVSQRWGQMGPEPGKEVLPLRAISRLQFCDVS